MKTKWLILTLGIVLCFATIALADVIGRVRPIDGGLLPGPIEPIEEPIIRPICRVGGGCIIRPLPWDPGEDEPGEEDTQLMFKIFGWSGKPVEEMPPVSVQKALDKKLEASVEQNRFSEGSSIEYR